VKKFQILAKHGPSFCACFAGPVNTERAGAAELGRFAAAFYPAELLRAQGRSPRLPNPTHTKFWWRVPLIESPGQTVSRAGITTKYFLVKYERWTEEPRHKDGQAGQPPTIFCQILKESQTISYRPIAKFWRELLYEGPWQLALPQYHDMKNSCTY